MKAYQIILLSMVAIAGFAGCGKKDNDSSTKYAKNAMGASAVNAEAIGTAFDQAGFKMDIINIHSVQNTNTQTLSATILVGNSSQQVFTTMGSVGSIVTGTTTIEGKTVRVEARCATANCSPYYLVATALINGAPVLQIGYKFYSALPTADQDTYQVFGTNQIGSFDTVVNVLN